jgi:VanZ family protein
MAILFLVSSQAIPAEIERFVPFWLDEDWLRHALAYAGLALVSLRATTAGRWRSASGAAFVAAWAIAAGYGLTDEWHQSFVPGRSADLRDAVANGAGALVALGGVRAWGIIRRRS